ncbi:phosphonate metabolism protein/1,5-bisphosphokinase (PRPP-forming) PhnN [Paludibacterium purpuratum]|uniref:Ribose 1,5-bisphosphate phosphokinase PhnN n=1 Tax=Paludibacterium purpuratum TaxID=1144873 RepID=A0A4R7BDG6_9NEIS|nr:phosphonate metabolism protein/1,5-bisphosphokinase (PRPP-forming) PhnN [Paludibacterium purpuratum]TDR82981.1 ribose 1,5-bisphosphokinase [Paludibacterium purpuratum]
MAAETIGRLWYVIGPSGAGKDSLLAYARERLSGQARLVFAHRYITRPADAGGENHIALSEQEFQCRERHGCFALCWRRHALCYALGGEVETWLAQGLDVVVNGSRSTLAAAAAHFPTLTPLWVLASPAILSARLRARGRETPAAIERRLREAAGFVPPCGSLVVQNDGSLVEGGEALVALLQRPPPSGG